MLCLGHMVQCLRAVRFKTRAYDRGVRDIVDAGAVLTEYLLPEDW